MIATISSMLVWAALTYCVDNVLLPTVPVEWGRTKLGTSALLSAVLILVTLAFVNATTGG